MKTYLFNRPGSLERVRIVAPSLAEALERASRLFNLLSLETVRLLRVR